MFKEISVAEVRFTHIEEIGADGQNSNTYRSHDHHLDAEIVIKRMAKAQMHSPTEFFLESKLLYMSSHPNVCQIHYACHDNDYIYLAMPLYRAGSLKNKIEQRYLTVREILVAGCQILSGLSNIHSKGLIHFDLKPDNVLVSDRGEAVIADFGQAKQIGLNGRAVQQRLYTKQIPPEAMQRLDLDRRFDIYQFGLTMYRLCNGNSDFNEEFASFVVNDNLDTVAFRNAVISGAFPNRTRFLPHIPAALRRVIRTCLEVSPDQRYQSAISTSNALASISGNLLDWRYARERGREAWIKNESGTLIEFFRNADGSSECFRTTSGGARRRHGAGCRPAVTDAQVRTFLGEN